jgi:thiol-disulfide isomerase/thioredoxin
MPASLRTILALLIVPAALSAVGCTREPASSAKATTDKEVTVTPLALARFDEMIASHKGKVVVVDFWFRGCVPCQEGMPHLVELQKKHGPDNLVVVTMGIEEPDNEKGRASAVEFLKNKNITLVNYVSDPGDETNLWTEKFNFGQFPMTQVYDRQGKLVEQFEGPHLPEVEELVGQLVKK